MLPSPSGTSSSLLAGLVVLTGLVSVEVEGTLLELVRHEWEEV